VTLDHEADAAVDARLEQIADYYATRLSLTATPAAAGAPPYKPVPPERLFLGRERFDELLGERPVATLSPYAAGDGERQVDLGGRAGRLFADARARPEVNLFDAVCAHLAAERSAGRRAVIAAYSAGSRDRLSGLLRDHGVSKLDLADGWADAAALRGDAVAVVVLGLERGFTTPDLAVISEQDILGDRLARPSRRRRSADEFIAEVSTLHEGDLVVHAEHGIGRYQGLETLRVDGALHDCLRLEYAGGDKLYLPVENIDVLSRYGSEDMGVQLDRLGAVAWQARKARVKERIREIADKLIAIAAERELKPGETLTPPSGAYDEFCTRFPYPETDDQLRAIDETLEDLGEGRPMDRLICGDVGFGKTEVALRAAFVTALHGIQVAVVVPTTLLCRQHYRTFRERFAGLPVRVEQLSRLTAGKEAGAVKAGLADGTIDLVIGTHALLGKAVKFRHLGLLIVDEEQHFGVAQKERLKQLKADVHVLTLTATPIPRTLQMALAGVKGMSLIATPPIDRLAVRTFVTPYDPVIVREAILRERFRGGQSFYVCPRIKDLAEVRDRLEKLVPEAKLAVAHGQLPASRLEAVVGAFYDGAVDVLVCTNIIESGLDIPNANTLVVHRADMFGLAQLYQLRGRIGRSKRRAYAYLTLPPRQKLTAAAEKRLEVMQTLDTLGAGFQLASYDLDIRGAGNLLGEEQSGHIREVGIELYQQMLEEAVATARGVVEPERGDRDWAPQISVGGSVLIPEGYVADLDVRLGLYRRIAYLLDRSEIEAFAAEMIDRFGPLPQEVENLLELVAIKRLCLEAGVAKLDAGPRGAVVAFRHDRFANPEGLIGFIAEQTGTVKLRPDHRLIYQRHRLIYQRNWESPKVRVDGVRRFVGRLREIAAAARA
jgi:transcription-repair coupling factor (superfamily II helicase)